MTEEEEQREVIQGVVYGYLEHLEAVLPEGNKVEIELHFRNEVRDLPTRREDTTFVIDRRMRLPLNIKLDSEGMMQDKFLLLRMFRITTSDERKLFGDFKINLREHFRPKEMEIHEDEIRARMTNKPVLRWSFAAYYRDDPRPQELLGFVYNLLHPKEAKAKPMKKGKSENHVRHLEDSSSTDMNVMRSQPVFKVPDESDSSFDEDITAQSLQLAKEESKQSGIEEFIVRNWYDLSKSEMGYPGYKLAHALVDRKGRVWSVRAEKSFEMLEDIRTTTSSVDSACRFYSACLCLYLKVKEIPALSAQSKGLACRALDTAASVIAEELHRIFLLSLNYVPGSSEFRKLVLSFTRTISKMKTASLSVLASCALEEFDCALANSFIAQSAFDTLSKIVNANTAIAEYESALHVTFPRFRQVLLVIIAHDSILKNPESCRELVPLVPPTFIYFAMLLIRPDNLMTEEINYLQIEDFAKAMKVNFRTNISEECMFHRPKKDLPEDCPEFRFRRRA